MESRGRWYYPQGAGIKPNTNPPGDYSRRHGRAIKNRKFKQLPKDTKPIELDSLPATPSSFQLDIISHANSPHANSQHIILPGSTKDQKQPVVVAKGRAIPEGHATCDTSFEPIRLTAKKKKRTRPNRSKPLNSINSVQQIAANPAILPSQLKNNPPDLGLDVTVSLPVKELATKEQSILNAHSTENLTSSTCSNETPLSPPPTDSLPAFVMQQFIPSPLPIPRNHHENISCQPPESNTHNLLVLGGKATLGKAGNAEPACQIPLYQEPLPHHPPIWAETRQEVCESFDWFRSYQGGVYHTHGIVKGYLLSAFSSKRDRFEHGGRLIISHGGGKAESIHAHEGRFAPQPAEDQLAQDKSVRALLKNFQDSRPLVLLIDDKYVLFPYDLGSKDVTYAVLGFYKIVHVWAEYHPSNNTRGQVVRYKFAFQWCEGQGEPWWLSRSREYVELTASQMPRMGGSSNLPLAKVEEYNLSSSRHSSPVGISFTCRHCQLDSPHVYHQSWACLNPSCPRFWKTSYGQHMPDQLEYRPEFLALKEECHLPMGFGDLRPSVPAADSGINTTYAFSRGWHCQKCGRLSCRFKWQKWECRFCQSTYSVPGSIRLPNEFWPLERQIQKSCQSHLVGKNSGVQREAMKPFVVGSTTCQYQTFILPEARGRLHHIMGGSPFSRAEADTIFREYQEQAFSGELPFRRWPLRSHKCRGTLLTHYFSHNTGEPYQYVGGAANTVPFDRAPGAVIKARDLIQSRILAALNITATFNEVLSAAYMEGQKMAFHSDSEIGLGPFVAGLSLGAPAMMHFRLHAKHDPERKHKGSAISFILRHGDILVMDGADVQEYYEHTVIPSDFRIAATARFIKPEHN